MAPGIETYREILVRSFPELRDARLSMLTELFGVLLLTELAGYEDYPDKLPQLVDHLRNWRRSLHEAN